MSWSVLLPVHARQAGNRVGIDLDRRASAARHAVPDLLPADAEETRRPTSPPHHPQSQVNCLPGACAPPLPRCDRFPMFNVSSIPLATPLSLVGHDSPHTHPTHTGTTASTPVCRTVSSSSSSSSSSEEDQARPISLSPRPSCHNTTISKARWHQPAATAAARSSSSASSSWRSP